jgi:hypothetical protein
MIKISLLRSDSRPRLGLKGIGTHFIRFMNALLKSYRYIHSITRRANGDITTLAKEFVA